MDSLEPRNRGERWVLHVGKTAQGKWWPLVWLLFAIILGLMCVWEIVMKKNILVTFFFEPFEFPPEASELLIFGMVRGALVAFSSAMFLCAAVLYFERRHFYLIIQRLKENIDSLGQQKPTFHKNAKE
jgi:hypothetical protein